MAGCTFYRVQDDSSATELGDEGFLAGCDVRIYFDPYRPRETKRLRECLHKHLESSGSLPSPFISTYDAWAPACREATRRVQANKKNVRICKVVVSRTMGEKLLFRPANFLMEALGGKPALKAGSKSEHEVVFFHCIPSTCIEWCREC